MFSGLSVEASGFFLLLSPPVSTPHSDSQVLVLFTLHAHVREIRHCGKLRAFGGMWAFPWLRSHQGKSRSGAVCYAQGDRGLLSYIPYELCMDFGCVVVTDTRHKGREPCTPLKGTLHSSVLQVRSQSFQDTQHLPSGSSGAIWLLWENGIR